VIRIAREDKALIDLTITVFITATARLFTLRGARIFTSVGDHPIKVPEPLWAWALGTAAVDTSADMGRLT